MAKIKIKTHKATAKRFSLTKSGKVKMNHQGRRHQVHLKTTKRKRALRKAGYIAEANAQNIKKLLPYA
ncbi:MAG: 50S ribosomal protein L35 [Clostridia bacterium]|nr:50S ribosomal protein L35 [Clostridia bacterium]MBQ2731151.1 50S ribosomal protein L35 [Clostridia bacterium]MBR6529863.1 50S ribosomal protein L35 [Clostridia bacterium]